MSKRISDAQIRDLQAEARDAGDWEMVVLCAHALDGEGELDCNDYTVVQGLTAQRLHGLTVEQAREQCESAYAEQG